MNRFIKAFYSLDSLAKPTNAAAGFMGTIAAPILGQLVSSGKFWVFVLFISVIAADWITGTAAAKKNESYSSEYGTSGVFRTVLLLWLPFIGYLLDQVALTVFAISQPGFAFYTITIMLIHHSWESATANAYRAGWERWIPKSVVSFVSSEIKAKAERALKQKGL
ncbi:phage holin family protein [Paenibacillus sp. TAB 01]|uniref:phage holin family protein n=1 Tax=Paenibacillus sp. TAB 01 TaxID=3368988 RepID=UPI0037532893